MTETIVIVISILVLGVCLSLSWTLYDSYKKLKSIEVDLMCIESRQKSILKKIDNMNTPVDYVASLLKDINGTHTNENKEK
jgi:hypothetical protein